MKAICRDEQPLSSTTRLSTRTSNTYLYVSMYPILLLLGQADEWDFVDILYVLTHNHAGDEFFGRHHGFFTGNNEDNVNEQLITTSFTLHLRLCPHSLLSPSFSLSSLLYSLIPYLLLSLNPSFLHSFLLSFLPFFSFSFSSSFSPSFSTSNSPSLSPSVSPSCSSSFSPSFHLPSLLPFSFFFLLPSLLSSLPSILLFSPSAFPPFSFSLTHTFSSSFSPFFFSFLPSILFSFPPLLPFLLPSLLLSLAPSLLLYILRSPLSIFFLLSSFSSFPYLFLSPSSSVPKKPPWWREREAGGGWELSPEEDAQDGGCARPQRVPHAHLSQVRILFKGTQDWEFFWLRFWNLRYFFVSYA